MCRYIAYSVENRYARWVIKLKMYIDIGAIRNNLRRIKSQVTVKLLFMVKADAYGHGLCETARNTEDLVDAFGVATVEEGIALRNAGISKDILVIACTADEIMTAADYGLSIGLANEFMLDAVESLVDCKMINAREIKLHLAVDTGMHRLGFDEGQIDGVLERLRACGLSLCGVYSHLRARNQRQIRCFERICAAVTGVYPDAMRHLAASHALSCRKLRYDMVRVGISAYEGAMRVESRVLAARRIEAGEFVSYGTFKLKKATNAAVVFGGYADGVAREHPSCVYIGGKRCRVLGNVCMDMCVVDCGDTLPHVGQRVILTDGEYIDEISKQRASINYTLMTCWKGRVERIYEYDESGGATDRKKCRSADEQTG